MFSLGLYGLVSFTILILFVPGVATAAADKDGPGPAAINKYIAPNALWYFRYGALLTWITGVIALHSSGIGVHNAFCTSRRRSKLGIGAWLGTIMLFNVWVFIWPNQKKILELLKLPQNRLLREYCINGIAN